MTDDTQIDLRGFDNAGAAQAVGDALRAVIEEIQTIDEPLDFSRLTRIIVAVNFNTAIQELHNETVSGNPIEYTNEEYAVAIAKVIILPDGDEYEIVPVLNANFVGLLFSNDKSERRFAIHSIHHEMCHVHDNNKKIEMLFEHMLKTRLCGVDQFTHPLADRLWSEYLANRLSSVTATQSEINMMCKNFSDALDRTKDHIDELVKNYRVHSDLDYLVSAFQRHGEFLIISAAYVAGYMDGVGQTLEELYEECAHKVTGSYFETTWNSLINALRDMYASYPNWNDMGAYHELQDVAEQFYGIMGFKLESMDDGRVHIQIPFREDNTPS